MQKPVYERIVIDIHLDLDAVEALKDRHAEELDRQMTAIASMAQSQAEAWLIEQWPHLKPSVVAIAHADRYDDEAEADVLLALVAEALDEDEELVVEWTPEDEGEPEDPTEYVGTYDSYPDLGDNV